MYCYTYLLSIYLLDDYRPPQERNLTRKMQIPEVGRDDSVKIVLQNGLWKLGALSR